MGNFQMLKKLVVRKSVIYRIAAVEYLILAERVSTPRDRTRLENKNQSHGTHAHQQPSPPRWDSH